MDIKNKVALITGGTKGIGYGIAKTMLEAGMHVAITGRNAESVSEAVNSLTANAPGGAIGIQADVRNLRDMQHAVADVLDHYRQLDVVVANAGLGHFGSIEELSPEQWNETIDTNLNGVYNTIKPAIEALKLSKGLIVTVASLAGTNFFAGGAAYNASKFGLVGFTQAIMLDLRKYGIRVSTIMPGSVSSHFNDHQPGSADDWKIQPEDIGQMVLDLMKMHPRTLPSKIEVRPTQPLSR